MRNILFFIRRHFNFLLFLALQFLSLFMIVQYNRYHHAVFNETAQQITGTVNKKYSNVYSYFHLKKVNDSLLCANQTLYNKLRNNFSIPDSIGRTFIDTLRIDSLLKFRKFSYIGAKVISNSLVSQSNYIVLDKGTQYGIREGMGVIDPNSSVVGIVTEVTPKYAIVMSMMHKDSHISAKLKRGGETGILSWDGAEPNAVFINNISKGAKVYRGDTAITSGFSTAFPKGMMVGRVSSVYKISANNYNKLKLNTTADFHSLDYVYVIANTDSEAVDSLLNKIKTNIENEKAKQ